MKLRLATPAVLVDVGNLRDLSYITRRRRPHRDRRAHPPPRRRAQRRPRRARAAPRARRPVRSATRRCATAARSRGSLAHGDPASDLPAVVLALGGTIVARGPGGERTIAASDFFQGFLETALAPDEVITEVRVRKTQRRRLGVREVQPPRAGLGDRRRGRGHRRRPGRRAREHGLHSDARRPRSRQRLAGGASADRRRRSRRRGHRSTVRSERDAGVPPAPRTRAHPARALSRATAGRRTVTANHRVRGRVARRRARPPRRRPRSAHRARHLHRQPRRRRHARASRSSARRSRTPTSTSIDTSDARAMPGVVGVYTADDLDVPEYFHVHEAQPGGHASTRSRRTACASSATSSRSSWPRRARRRSTRPRPSIVDYDPLPAVTDLDDALAPDAPLLFERSRLQRAAAAAAATPATRSRTPKWSCAAASRTSASRWCRWRARAVAVVPG